MQQTNLPREWEITNVTNVFSQISTTGKNIKIKDCLEFGMYPVIDQGEEYISGYFDDESKVIKVTDSIIAFGDHTKNIKWIDFDFIVGADGVKLFQPKKGINARFFYYQIKNFALPDKGYHRHFRYLQECDFKIPPLSEQTHLANLLDDLTTRVQKIQESLSRIPELLKTFRQSVLARAVSGELTAEWRGTFDYQEKDRFIFSSDWTVSNLGKEFNYGKCQKKNPDEIFSDEWVLELEDIEKDTSKLLVKVYNSERKVKSTKNIFEKGDVLYGKLRPYLNKIILADDNGVCTTEIIPIKTNDKILKNYLFYWLKSPYFSNFVNQLTYGINMPRLGTADGKKILFVYPNLEEQQQIVHQVEHYFALADEIEHQTKLAQEKVNYLTQSILAKAFRGELTANWRAANQAVISGENSAKALLAKIENELKKGKK